MKVGQKEHNKTPLGVPAAECYPVLEDYSCVIDVMR